MSARHFVGAFLVCAFFSVVLATHADAQVGVQWATFAKDTNRIQNPSGTVALQVTTDTQEKDYAWGDVNQDGWIDLVVVRKQPASTTGHRINQLLMNEHGYLVDRTTTYAVDSDVPGDFGFMTPTNDRDVQVVDLDGDGWLDIVTATDLSDGDPKYISHPRVYRNKGSVGGVWQGFRYEEARIPQLLVLGSGLAVAPRSCSVSVGDVTGDGFPDLYLTDADNENITTEPAAWDLDDRLLVNDGFGFFTDSGQTRMTAAMLQSTFTTSSKIVDMNGDGVRDVVKCASGPPVPKIQIAYNDPANVGFFSLFQPNIQTSAPYHIDVADLNADGKLDLIVGDDGNDSVRYNTGNDANGQVIFGNIHFYQYASSSPHDDGFAGNCLTADLDGDGLLDTIHADFDTEVPGCTRRCHIFHNLNTVPGVQGNLREEAEQTGLNGWKGVVGTLASDLTGTYDVAVLDIDNDGDLDMVFGRCVGTQVWLNQRFQVIASTTFCPGDGSGTACPCGNNSAVGNSEGCLSSLGTGGKLAGSGAASVSNDTFHLDGSRMPDSSVLYFQGTTQVSGGAGVAFGDGLRCVGGTTVRLSIHANTGGSSVHPTVANTPISVQGAIASGATRHYQAWYRNIAAFCSPETYNLTNGVSVTWQP